MEEGKKNEEQQKEKGKEKRSGGMKSTILISLQKKAIINFFACDRLERVLGRHIQETAAVENGRKRRLPQMPRPAFTFYSLKCFFSSLLYERAHLFHVTAHMRELLRNGNISFT